MLLHQEVVVINVVEVELLVVKEDKTMIIPLLREKAVEKGMLPYFQPSAPQVEEKYNLMYCEMR